MSTLLTLKLLPGRTRLTRRATTPLREVIVAVSSGALHDPVREPEGLQVPMSARARRLMRSGRVNGW